MLIEPGAGGAELRLQQVPDPRAGPGELLLAVRAIGMNRADLLLRAGHYERIPTRPPAAIAGLEAAGEVIAIGDGTVGFKIGDRVMGMPSGAYAEKVLLHHRLALRVPNGFSWEEAAALPVALLTAHDALISNGNLAPGEHVLVQGATTGVGILAMQIAKLLGARCVIGTSRTAAKLARLAPYGLDVGIDTGKEDFAKRVLDATADHGADVIIDLVGASAAAGHIACAALKARWVQVGRVSGAKAEIDLNELSRKRIRLVGVTFRTRSLDEFAQVVSAAERDLGTALAARTIISPVDRVFALERAGEAIAYMRSNAHLGKIVLKP